MAPLTYLNLLNGTNFDTTQHENHLWMPWKIGHPEPFESSFPLLLRLPFLLPWQQASHSFE
jgi:hypothetical protein